MINLTFDELRLIAQIRNISDYENKSKEDLIKALSETKPQKTKPEKTKPETPKPEKTSPGKTKLEKTKPEIRVNKKKPKILGKDFDELRHKFSRKEIDRYRKAFYVDKKKKYLSKSEIKKTNKSFNRLKKVRELKNFAVILIALIMKTLIIMIIIMILLMMMNIEKLEVLEHYLKN